MQRVLEILHVIWNGGVAAVVDQFPEPERSDTFCCIAAAFPLLADVAMNRVKVDPLPRKVLKSGPVQKTQLEDRLSRACRLGDVRLAERQLRLCPYTKNATRVLRVFLALRAACEAGKLETAKWLSARFHIDKTDVIYECPPLARYSVLASACGNGHLPVVKWLHDTFELDEESYRASSVFDADDCGADITHSALALAFASGDCPTIQWVVDKANVSRDAVLGRLWRGTGIDLLYHMFADHEPDSPTDALAWVIRNF